MKEKVDKIAEMYEMYPDEWKSRRAQDSVIHEFMREVDHEMYDRDDPLSFEMFYTIRGYISRVFQEKKESIRKAHLAFVYGLITQGNEDKRTLEEKMRAVSAIALKANETMKFMDSELDTPILWKEYKETKNTPKAIDEMYTLYVMAKKVEEAKK